MNRKDFYHVNEKDPLRGKTILVYMHSEYYIVTTKDGKKCTPNYDPLIHKPSIVVLFDIKEEKDIVKFGRNINVGYAKALCGKYNEEDPTNSEVDYSAFLLLSDDKEEIEKFCKDYNIYSILKMEECSHLDFFGCHFPSSFSSAVIMYNSQEIGYGYQRKKNNSQLIKKWLFNRTC